jgi:hypothetical protein
MDEHVLAAAAVGLDETVTFGRIEPLHCTARHVVLTLERSGKASLPRGLRQDRARRSRNLPLRTHVSIERDGECQMSDTASGVPIPHPEEMVRVRRAHREEHQP